MTIHDKALPKSPAPATATLAAKNKTVELPVRSGTIGPDVVDIATVYRDTGMFTYDPGFTSTANCSSKITYIVICWVKALT